MTATVCSKLAAAVCSKQAAAVCNKQAATVCNKQAATKSKKSNLHTKNSQAATMPQLAAAAKPHACCGFAAIHCEKPFISIRDIIVSNINKHLAFESILADCQHSF